MIKQLALFLLLGCSLFGEEYRYSVIRIKNETPNSVSYQYRWGGDKGSPFLGSNELSPGQVYLHWYEFDYPGQNYAPQFYVRINGDNRIYRLRSFFSVNQEESAGRVYRFYTEDGRVTIQELSGYAEHGLYYEVTD
jgi:hypothetical protein